MRTSQVSFAVLCLTLAIATASGCKKDDINPTDPVPLITAVTITPTTVTEFVDSVVFAVSYKDGDGDLGENDPNAENLFIIDNRIQITEAYRIQELAPAGSAIPIEGTLNVVLPATGITDGSASQQATFTVYVRDRAGHESNRYVTPAVTIVR